MKTINLISLISISTLCYSLSAQAQAPNYQQYYNQSSQQQTARQALQYQEQLKMQQLQQHTMPSYPKATKFKRIAPKPLTEAMLQQHLDEQLLVTTMQLSIDKQQAERYAANFALYQKQQADGLKNMMQQADMNRERILNQIKQQNQRIMASFKRSLINTDSKK